jgi:GNAT superfamily N-acetyltransferase
MTISVVETTASALSEYGDIPSVLNVHEILEVVDVSAAPAGARLVPRRINPPYLKDYDAPPAWHPSRWREHFDVGRWGFLTVTLEAEDVGRAAIAWRTPEVELLEGRNDLALLWDLRVQPACQRRGIGTVLLSAAEEWAKTQGARLLKIETQNINAPACRFYEARGCVLGAYHRHAYPELPHEVQLLWYKELV